jgi:hypothetical protein
MASSGLPLKRSDRAGQNVLAFQDLVQYTKNDDGSWKAEFHGSIDITVDGPTLERCRHGVLDALDAALEAWITGRQQFARRIPRRDQ